MTVSWSFIHISCRLLKDDVSSLNTKLVIKADLLSFPTKTLLDDGVLY